MNIGRALAGYKATATLADARGLMSQEALLETENRIVLFKGPRDGLTVHQLERRFYGDFENLDVRKPGGRWIRASFSGLWEYETNQPDEGFEIVGCRLPGYILGGNGGFLSYRYDGPSAEHKGLGMWLPLRRPVQLFWGKKETFMWGGGHRQEHPVEVRILDLERAIQVMPEQ